jgi:hypothetical protein
MRGDGESSDLTGALRRRRLRDRDRDRDGAAAAAAAAAVTRGCQRRGASIAALRSTLLCDHSRDTVEGRDEGTAWMRLEPNFHVCVCPRTLGQRQRLTLPLPSNLTACCTVSA